MTRVRTRLRRSTDGLFYAEDDSADTVGPLCELIESYLASMLPSEDIEDTTADIADARTLCDEQLGKKDFG